MELVKSITRPSEFLALIQFQFGAMKTVQIQDWTKLSPTLKRCYQFLVMTSRSFASVIQALDGELRDAICIFYLVLRALDTLEDDMTIPVEEKTALMKELHENLYNPEWKYRRSQEVDKIVLEEFPVISAEFRNLDKSYRDVIQEITKRMADGMCKYLDCADVNSFEDWNEYCHYVAGLVGIGLSRIFSASKLEDEIVGEDEPLSNSMGLFLQKTNIIRDYLADIQEGRKFWPKEAWSKFAKRLEDFQDASNRDEAVRCLNFLITNALHHVPDAIKYLSRLRNQSVFNFCAIPQVMAIGTLAVCYNNPDVFTTVVKLRKGQAVYMMKRAVSLNAAKIIFHDFAAEIAKIAPKNDPTKDKTLQICETILMLTHVKDSGSSYLPVLSASSVVLFTALWYYYNGTEQVYRFS
ncbi:uncharacterized protein TRIADDRAFT_27912 [Trichoplax adhaerens]|uniref:Squalene synthase n=1 Tax=Trichoplax adhaerens TaxID=10228 RepID=B3S1Z2_TRIAD|nr:hypothetical protein TRIADDRAFT_27912 [Trichoplax adhaerens]EDV23275.1 hypothetical protein TRIADDRAFT_27912 [Trichoplax adhaerens]|eukprot:XP_002114185.1 hypothetical protein TRIADDRAFT_27912 [Trichoplax adhaerens]